MTSNAKYPSEDDTFLFLWGHGASRRTLLNFWCVLYKSYWRFIVRKTFLELCSKTELQRSAKQVKQLVCCDLKMFLFHFLSWNLHCDRQSKSFSVQLNCLLEVWIKSNKVILCFWVVNIHFPLFSYLFNQEQVDFRNLFQLIYLFISSAALTNEFRFLFYLSVEC